MIVCAQLVAFGRVNECRGEGRAQARMKREPLPATAGARKTDGKVDDLNGNGHAIRIVEHVSKSLKSEDQEDGSFGTDPRLWNLEASDEDSTKSSIFQPFSKALFYSVAFTVLEYNEN